MARLVLPEETLQKIRGTDDVEWLRLWAEVAFDLYHLVENMQADEQYGAELPVWEDVLFEAGVSPLTTDAIQERLHTVENLFLTRNMTEEENQEFLNWADGKGQ